MVKKMKIKDIAKAMRRPEEDFYDIIYRHNESMKRQGTKHNCINAEGGEVSERVAIILEVAVFMNCTFGHAEDFVARVRKRLREEKRRRKVV